VVDTVLVRTHFIAYDSRLNKIFKSLNKKYSVLVFGWNREDKVTKKMKGDNTMNIRYFNFKAPYGKPRLISYAYMLAYFSLFWTWIFANLVFYRPKVVHAFDLDTVLPCYIYKKLFRKKLVFEVVDRYAMNSIPQRFKLTFSLVNYLEEFFSSRADLLITIGEKMLDTFHNKPRESLVILNCPEDINKEYVAENNSVFRVIYTDRVISKIRGVKEVVASIEGLTNVELIIVGLFIDKELENHISRVPGVNYRGILKPPEALNLEASSDSMIALYDPKNPQTSVCTPTKFFEAMMCGIALITNIRPDLVIEIGFGIIVEYGNIDQIRSAIIRLRDDPELRKRLGNNGRKAFLERYNWGIMEKKLYDAYENLI
jgi:glycosyltransferase involved in cell wall biosynthesis